MIPIAIAILAVLAMAPLAVSLRRNAVAQGRRERALEVHRAQLVELDRDLTDGRIAAADHAQARLEVQRRLLAAAAGPDELDTPRTYGRWPLLVALVLVPLGGFGLYLVGGHPELPAAPRAEHLAAVDQQARESAALVDMLRQRLAQLDPTSDTARQGYVLLGNAQDSLGRLPEAAAAWRTALGIRFDATLAAQTAEAQARLDGQVTPATAALFRRALAVAPPDAPWRALAEQRLSEAVK